MNPCARLLPALLVARVGMAAVPCVDCWNQQCPQFEGPLPRCAEPKPKPAARPGRTSPMPVFSTPVAEPTPAQPPAVEENAPVPASPVEPAWATEETEPRTDLVWLHLHGGTFRRGCLEQDTRCELDEPKPPVSTDVAELWMTQTEVTVRAYAACAKAGACPTEPLRRDAPLGTCNWKHARADHPMNCVTHDEAKAFCAWVGGRLPSAEAWEYAARSGREVVYPWGDEPVTGQRANFCDVRCLEALPDPLTWKRNGWVDGAQDDGHAGTAPVGTYDAGVTAWGLQDMAGNVAEWTDSPSRSGGVEVRGGGWYHGPYALRSSFHLSSAPTEHRSYLGFRCAR